MSRLLGKLDQSQLAKIILRSLGARRGSVLMGPRVGVDTAIICTDKSDVLITTSDPISLIPKLGATDSAWLSVNLIASDLATSGIAPEYALFTLTLPQRMSNLELKNYWMEISRECKKLGVSVVGGHTGRYGDSRDTIIGSGTMIATAHKDAYLTASMARDGDDIIVTKGAAIETTAVLARVFPRKVEKALGEELFEKARQYLRKVSTVTDSLTAASIGLHNRGVTAMHDATEGGVVSALLDLACASGLGATVDFESIPVSVETREVCRLFKLNPFTSLSEGTLIIASRPDKSAKVLRKLAFAGVTAQVVGALTARRKLVWGLTRDKRFHLRYPRCDPYWKAYASGIRKGWK